MISCDTNILFPAFNADSADHPAARAFFLSMTERKDVVLAEQVLLELYVLVRNPVVCKNPLSAKQAVSLVSRLRAQSSWRIVDVVPGYDIAEKTWQVAGQQTVAYRRIFDARLAFTLLHHGVTEFATRNRKDFEGFGFETVMDPTRAS